MNLINDTLLNNMLFKNESHLFLTFILFLELSLRRGEN